MPHASSVLEGITFALERGKVLTILGESESGKSVTLRSLVRLLPRVRTRLSGEVILKGGNLYELAEWEVQNLRGSLVAMIFQEPMTALDPVYTVGEQIVETLVRHQHMTRAQARQRALELFELVQIPSPERRLRFYPHEISGGMRQRAMIAIALAHSHQGGSVRHMILPTIALSLIPMGMVTRMVRASVLEILSQESVSLLPQASAFRVWGWLHRTLSGG